VERNPQNWPWAHLIPHFHDHGHLRGNSFLDRGPLRVALRLTVANPNPAWAKTATVTSACKTFGRTRCYWRISPVARLMGAQPLRSPSHPPAGPTTSMPLSGIGQDQIASLIKFLRFLRLTGALLLRSSPFSRRSTLWRRGTGVSQGPLISDFLCASICCLDLDPGKFLTPVRG
jgi:hypothetical protein